MKTDELAVQGWRIEKRKTGWPPGEWEYDRIVTHTGSKPNFPPSPNGAYEYRSRALVIREAAARLRAQDGERIEGWVISEETQGMGQGTLMRFKTGPVRGWPDSIPATLILHDPEEPKK